MGRNVNSTITNSYATGEVSGLNYVGGLVGWNENSTITNSYATGKVIGTNTITGGLVGNLASGSITESYAAVEVSGASGNIGGLVGMMGAVDSASITNSYATGAVSGILGIGGLVGNIDASNDGTIEYSYATGLVNGGDSGVNIGGLVGEDSTQEGVVSLSYWDKESTGTGQETSSGGGEGYTTAEMQTIDAFAGWSIEEDSTIEKGTPFLAWQKSDNGYTKTWVIGTKEPTRTDSTTNSTTNTNKKNIIRQILNKNAIKIKNIITQIANRNAINIAPRMIKVRVIRQPRVSNMIGKLKRSFANISTKKIISRRRF